MTNDLIAILMKNLFLAMLKVDTLNVEISFCTFDTIYFLIKKSGRINDDYLFNNNCLYFLHIPS